jgi:bacteriorhodopsin
MLLHTCGIIRIQVSARSRQSYAELFVSPLVITNSVMAMMKQLNWTPLEVRCNNARLVMMYRIVYDLADTSPATNIQQS